MARGELRVLVLLAHPRGTRSLNGALAAAYARGAVRAGAAVELVDLAGLDFERDVLLPSPAAQAAERGLARLREQIDWADHLTLVYPTWWGTHPALLKSVLDRVLVPGWAFRETTAGTGFEGLLKGKTAEILTTMDTPPAVYRLLYRAPGDNCLRRATLGFCGIDTCRTTHFSAVKTSTEADRQRWLHRAEGLGRRLEGGVLTRRTLAGRRLAAWASALRLQFYPMTFLAYCMGSLGAARLHESSRELAVFWLGYLVVFLTEAATVFGNTLFDFQSDRRNRFYGPFTGGSRVMVDGSLSGRALAIGTLVAAGGAAVAAAILIAAIAGNRAAVAAIFVATFVLGLGYTVPPLKLCHRSLGEPTVALTHSVAVVLFGFAVQQGSVGTPWPWLVSLPLFFAILPAITLSGVPDAEADAAAGKRSLAVRFGIRQAFDVALGATVLAVASAAAVAMLLPSSAAFWALTAVAGVHGIWLARGLVGERRAPAVARRIDRLMVTALGFTLWFALVPLVGLLLGG